MNGAREVRVAVDIGGTFTDVAIEVDGRYVTAKRSTTPEHPMNGVLDAVTLGLGRADLTPADVNVVLQHGTTLATNAIIERRGAVVGLVTTEGFRDVLEIAYERRYDQYDLGSHRPDPLVPRRRCYTVSERVGSDGSVLRPLDEDSVMGVLESMERDGVESVAVGLINSFANPTHEQQIAALIERFQPQMAVSQSSELSPELREYDRLCTAVANAYIKPLMTGVMLEFAEALKGQGFNCPVLMMTSAGGMTSVEAALRFPIRLLESGPSGGAVLAARVATQRANRRRCHSIWAERPRKCASFSRDSLIALASSRWRTSPRLTKGSGFPIRIPAIDIIETGAGGGSIARVEQFRGLVVGPESAGAEPGPASYGRGGTRPTVTDADCVLGYLDPDQFGDGDIKLSRDNAAAALLSEVANPLGLPVEESARAVCDVVEESMANAARVHAAERGFELSESVLIAFGGNGPVHAAQVARKVGIGTVIVPPSPGVGSAIGFLCAPVSHEIVRSNYCLMEQMDVKEIDQMLHEMETEARKIVEVAVPGLPITIKRSSFMRYRGQGHEIEVVLPDGALTEASKDKLRLAYETQYAGLFGRIPPRMSIEITNWAVSTASPDRELAVGKDAEPSARRSRSSPEAVAKREVFIGSDQGSLEVPVFERRDLVVGDKIIGPALIAEPQTTTYVPGLAEAVVDEMSNLVIALEGGLQ